MACPDQFNDAEEGNEEGRNKGRKSLTAVCKHCCSTLADMYITFCLPIIVLQIIQIKYIVRVSCETIWNFFVKRHIVSSSICLDGIICQKEADSGRLQVKGTVAFAACFHSSFHFFILSNRYISVLCVTAGQIICIIMTSTSWFS